MSRALAFGDEASTAMRLGLGRCASYHLDSSLVTFNASRAAAFPMLAAFVVAEVPASFPYGGIEEFAVTIVTSDIHHGGLLSKSTALNCKA
jgi:hypothetical protein